jgi:hypothetical protein
MSKQFLKRTLQKQKRGSVGFEPFYKVGQVNLTN